MRFEMPVLLYGLWLLPFVAAVWLLGRTRLSVGWRVVCAALRILVFTSLVLALARPVSDHDATRKFQAGVVFLIDRSASIGTPSVPGDPTAPLQGVLPADVKAQTLYFGANPERSAAAINAAETDIEKALDAGCSLIRSGVAGRLVLVSDGRATHGDAVSAAARAKASGVAVDVMPIGVSQPHEPAIVAAIAPENLRVGTTEPLRVQIRADEPGEGRNPPIDARIMILDDHDREVTSRLLTLSGDCEVALPVMGESKGGHNCRVVLQWGRDPRIDSIPLAYEVFGPPEVLISDPEAASVSALTSIVHEMKLKLTLCTPNDFPKSVQALSQYDLVVLSDWPAPNLSEQQLADLTSHVQQGAGLMFIGGVHVATAKWHGSPLEALLPVRFKPPLMAQRRRFKPVHVCYVLDVSGSMDELIGEGTAAGSSKMRVMMNSVLEALSYLPDSAQVSVVTFSAQARVVLNAIPIEPRERIVDAIQLAGIESGTVIGDALRRAVDSLRGTACDRYMIVLTDGHAFDSKSLTMAWSNEVRAAKINVTALGVGKDHDHEFLQWVATSTGGKYESCSDSDCISKVFTGRAKEVKSTTALEEPPISPQLGPVRDLLESVATSNWPLLTSAVPAQPADDADLHLMNPDGRALLAGNWVGAGRVFAFLSDVKAYWARDWIEWPGFPVFWRRLITDALRRPSGLYATLDVRVDGNRCTILLEFDAGTLVESAGLSGILTPAEGASHSKVVVTWRRLSPLAFEGVAELQGERRFLGALRYASPDGVVQLRRDFAVSLAISPELQKTGPDERALRAIAAAGGGAFAPTAEEFSRSLGAVTEQTLHLRTSYWPYLLSFSLLLWPLDLAIRRRPGAGNPDL